MRHVPFGATGLSVSEICFGSMLCGTSVNEENTFRALDDFVDRGGNFIDTANCYAWWVGKGEFIGDESELLLGRWMRSRGNRDQLILASKCGARLMHPHSIRDPEGTPYWERVGSDYEGLSKSAIISAVDDSLRRMGTDYLDIEYTHVYDSRTPISETLATLDSLVSAGKIRVIGASNITTAALREADKAAKEIGVRPYAALQQEYSFLHPKAEADTGYTAHGNDEMFEYVRERDLGFTAYSPLLKGIYMGKAKREAYYNWGIYESEETVAKLDRLDAYARALNITTNQLILAWMLRREPCIVPILGFSKLPQYLENIEVTEIHIPEAMLREINALHDRYEIL